MTKNNAVVKYDKELIKEARQLTNTKTGINKTPLIKVSYNETEAPKGHFVQKLWNQDDEIYEDTDLGENFRAVILATTIKCSEWDKELEATVKESNEFFDRDEDIFLLDDKGELIQKGTYAELKKSHPNLKYQVVLYLRTEEGHYVKFFLKGKSLGEFWDYEQAIMDSGGALQAQETIFRTEEETNGAVVYYVIKLDRGAEIDLQEMVEYSKEVFARIQKRRLDLQERIERPEVVTRKIAEPEDVQVAEVVDDAFPDAKA